jgi:putative ABC transport system permease protein
MSDLRYAFRTLRTQPVFALVAVLTLTLGIGANTAIFSVLYQVILRPLPYRDAERLVFVWNTGKDGGRTNVSIPDYLDRRAAAPAIEDATLFTARRAIWSASGRPEQLVSLAVTPSFFSTLGRGPQLGRAFANEDATPGDTRCVILTDAFWRSHYGADASLVGRTIQVNGENHLVVGILPRDFELPVREVSLLVPFAFTPAQMSDQERGNEFSMMIARLRKGATVGQFDAQMQAIVVRLIDRLPRRAAFMRNSGFTGMAVPIRDQLVGDARAPLWLLQAGVLLVLLIACANVANLLLMRVTGRSRELAIRATLGANPWRIVRQLFVEGSVLAMLGATGGLAVAAVGIRALVVMIADQVPAAGSAAIDAPVLAFTFGVALATGLVFGIVPALPLLSAAPSAGLRDDTTRGSASRRTGAIRAMLVVAEVAVAVMLLVGAGLLVKSFARVLRVNPGFTTDHVLSAQVALPASRYRDPAAIRGFWIALVERLAAIPGVTSAALTDAVPFSGQDGSGTYRLVDRPPAPNDRLPHAFLPTVGGDYFRTLGIPVLAGRVFTPADTPTSPRVVVIDEYLAKRQFPGVDPVGRQLNFGSPRNYTIVGVVGTINGGDLAIPVPEERIYFDVVQVAQPAMGIVVKGTVDAASLTPQVRAAVQSLNAEQAISDVRTLDERLSRALQPRRTPTTLLALFGGIALILAAIGIYGVLAFGVAERSREFGIRQALGADRASILSLVLAQGLRTAGAGVLLGLGGAFVLTRYLQSLLYEVTTHDVSVFAAATAVLFTVALLACYLPARRATRVDPAVALRAT